MKGRKNFLKMVNMFLLFLTIVSLASILGTWRTGVEPISLFLFAVSGGLYLFIRCRVTNSGSPLNKVLLVISCVFLVGVGMLQFGDVGRDDSDGYVSGDSDNYIDSSMDSDLDANENTGEDLNVDSTVNSNSDSEVKDSEVSGNDYVYNLSEIGNLSGFFCLNLEDQTIKDLGPKMETVSVSYYLSNGNKLGNEVGQASNPLVEIDRTNGEKLIVAGSEGTRISEQAKCGAATMVGYSNMHMLGERRLDTIESIADVDVSTVNKDVDAVNSAISNTGFSVSQIYSNNIMGGYREVYLADTYNKTFTYGCFDGTEYVETNIAMMSPIVIIDYNNIDYQPVEKTRDGYFVIDISSLPTGCCVVNNGINEYFAFIIK